jgi:hypothetical protein
VPTQDDLTTASDVGETHGPAVHVGLRRETIGDDAPLQTRQQPAHASVVQAGDGRAIERHTVREGHECVLHRLDRSVGIKVLGLDGRQQRQDGEQRQE